LSPFEKGKQGEPSVSLLEKPTDWRKAKEVLDRSNVFKKIVLFRSS